MENIASRPVLDGHELDAAIANARAALSALLGGGTGYPKVITEARALLSALLDHRLALAMARLDERDPAAVTAARADRDEAIAVTGALLYWLPSGDPAWPDVAMTVGRLSYDRYSDPWPDAEPPDPDDLDAACDLLLRAAQYEDVDERLLAFPAAGGLGRASLHDMLELELRDRGQPLVRVGGRGSAGLRSLRLAGSLG